ncbi:MAG: nucleotidyltransferase domain-containing protein [Candidatus Cyclobacteriaceae bacterium M3_2C_046]
MINTSHIGLTNSELEIISSALNKFDLIDSAILFGSRAKGNFQSGADVDLAIKGNELTDEIRLQLSGFLNEETPLPLFFDVVIFHHIKNKALIKHIERVGIEIYQKVSKI